MRSNRDLRTEDEGAEVIEFALVFPIVAFLIFGLIYGLLAVAAHASLAHAASRGVRYASIATDSAIDTYPSTDDVASHVAADTPFFSPSNCDTKVVGESRENAPLTLDVTCDFPNPMGSALSALRNVLLHRNDPDAYSSGLSMSAHAEARRE